MNTQNQAKLPDAATTVELTIDAVIAATNRLEKVIDVLKSRTRLLDDVANKLNPQAFHKNWPVTECTSKDCAEPMAGAPRMISGMTQTLDVLSVNLNSLIGNLEYFSDNELTQTVNFFKEQI